MTGQIVDGPGFYTKSIQKVVGIPRGLPQKKDRSQSDFHVRKIILATLRSMDWREGRTGRRGKLEVRRAVRKLF